MNREGFLHVTERSSGRSPARGVWAHYLLQWGEGLAMSGRHRASNNRHFRHRFVWRALHRTIAFSAMLFLIAEIAAVGVSVVTPGRARAATAPKGQGFTVTPGDLNFIMKQI